MRLALAPLLLAACGPLDLSGDCATACVADAICVSGTCEAAFPRSYQLVAEVSLAPKDPDGNCWDEPFCGDPDPLESGLVRCMVGAGESLVSASIEPL